MGFIIECIMFENWFYLCSIVIIERFCVGFYSKVFMCF